MDYQLKIFLWKNHAENMHQKLVPDLFIIFVNNRNSHCMQEIALKVRYFKEDYQKALIKVTLFFLLNPVPFNGQNYQKQKRLGTSDQSLFGLRNKLRKIPLLVMYCLTKFGDVI